MATVAAEPRTCAGCGAEFEPNHGSRTYCFQCSPPGRWLGAAAPEPLLFERIPAEAFTVAHFREWAEEKRLKDGSSFEVDGYQELFLEDLFAREPDGRPTFSELWLILPEGNGKTTFLALVVLYVVEFSPEAWVPVAASARDQAVDLTYRIAAGFVQRNGLEQAFRLHPGYRTIVHNGSRGAAKIFASDAASGDGVDPTLALIEELHRLASMDLYETWAGKLEKSGGQLVVVSTAGEPGGPFEELRERMRQLAADTTRDGCFLRAVGPGTVLHEYALPEGADPEDLDLVASANPYRGITVESLERKRSKPSWNLAHWRRFTCNVPTRESDAAVEEAEWDAALVAEGPPDGAELWGGLDLGWKWDTSAWVPFWPRDADFRLVCESTILEPPQNGQMLDVEKVKRAIYETADRYVLRTVVMDMSDGADLAQWMLDQGIEVVDRAQSNAFAVQDYERFMEGLRAGWLKRVADPVLARHVFNAITRILPGGEARFDRPKEARNTKHQRRRVVDGLTAAGMVNSLVWAEFSAEDEAGEIMVAYG